MLVEGNKLKALRGTLAVLLVATLVACGGAVSVARASRQTDVIRRVFGSRAGVAECIAERESRLSPRAVHVNADGSFDRGLFQINSVWIGHVVEFYTRHHGARILVTVQRLFRPAANARIAWAISRAGTNWRPWNTSGGC